MKDLNSLNTFLQELSTKANNLTPILYHTQDALYQKSMDSFEKEKDAFGNPWKPTKSLKTRRVSCQHQKLPRTGNSASFGKKKILQDTGVLKESIVARNNGVNKVSIGSNLSYAPIHQFGGKAGRGGKAIIPARPYLPISKERKIPEDLKRSIKQAIKKHLGF
ncbi:phage virion morphogenesis protein [Helicobacter cholecystus]|uniref:phage virion morphogenesis protein n=1 Tax=Helicobacter cholecystus TaxID=45498 RepID=UPI0027388187|nr:phage virion morphogenesis protein [Helicobacter cholecystus]